MAKFNTSGVSDLCHAFSPTGQSSSQNLSGGLFEAGVQVITEFVNDSNHPSNAGLEISVFQILDSSDDCIKVLDLEGRILYMSRGGQVLLGIQDVGHFLHTSWIEFWQGAEQQAASEAIAKARAGEVCTFQGYCPTPNHDPKWWDCKVSPIRGIDGQVERLLCISRDITERRQIEDERKRAEIQLRRAAEIDAFRVKLSDALRPLTDATEIQKIAARILGESLGATRVIYIEVVADGQEVIVHCNYTNGVAELKGRYRLEDYRRNLTLDHQSGRTQVVTDIPNSSRYTQTEKTRYHELDIAAHIDVPLIKNNQFVALFAVQQSTPHQWSETEVKLAEETAEQTWTTVERARVEAALRKSEAQLAADLAGMRRLYNLYATLATELDLKTALNEILTVVCEFTHTERGCVQLISHDGTRLEMFTWRGYLDDSPFINHFRYEGFKEGCDRARVTRQRLIIEETIGYPGLEGTEAGAAVYAEGIRATQSTPIINRSGESIGVLSTQFSYPHRPSDDELRLVDLLAWTAADFVERYRAHTALRESEKKYRSLFESMNDGFCIIELIYNEQQQVIDYRFLETNPAFERQSGLRNPIGKTGLYFAPNHDPQLLANYQQALVTGEPIDFEIGMADLGRYYRISVNRHGDLQKKQLAIVFNDITERKRVEDERKQTEAAIAADLRDTQLLRDLSAQLATEESIQALYQEIIAAAIALTHADAGTVQILDNTTQELVLLATQGIEQKMVKHFYRINASSNTPCGIALRSGIRSFVDFDVPASQDPAGSMRLHLEAGFLSAQSTPLISRSGRSIGMVSTHWRTRHRPSERELRFLDLLARQAADLIEQRQAEAQRKQLLEQEQAAREAAERANRIKDEFLAVLSHELRSPLNPILGWTRLLQSGKLNTARQQEALATIERNAKLQTQLIEDLLDISRIMQGKLSLTVSPVSLPFVISAAIETVRLAAEAKQIQILLDLATTMSVEQHSEGIAPISGDAARLQQVLWNLLSNAVKFTPQGGQVTVELRQINQLAQIRVIDTGKGISPDFLPHVFEYFRQADATTTRKFGGLGLGLAIVKQIVEMHGGTVKAESLGENQGATFTVQLPIMQQIPSTVLEPNYAGAANQETPLSNLQILVVDDDDDTREFQAFLLEQNGARVTAVASGLEALQVLDRCIPDVLVSDVGMGQMDGYMLIQHIRSHPSDRGGMIPAIALTAYAAEVDQQKAIQAGFQTHITKPVDSEALLGAIVSLLRSAR